jgi:uncharacterized membrane protein YphA (DoxX/SURF4 family)
MAVETRTEVTSAGIPVSPAPLQQRIYPTTAVSLGLLFARLPLGVYFIVAAISKLRMGIGTFASGASASLPDWSLAHKLPPNFVNTFLHSLPWIELAVGIFITVGFLTRVWGLVVSLLLISFMASMTGMSGSNLKLPFHPNLVLLGVSLAVLLCGPGRISVDGFLFGRKRKVVIREEYTERLP